MLFFIAIVAALVNSACENKEGYCTTGNQEYCSTDNFANGCKLLCGRCEEGATGSTSEKCVTCLDDYFRDLESDDKQAKAKIATCRANAQITKDECDADPCYQTTYKDCRKANYKAMDFEEWSRKCKAEASSCQTKLTMKKDFCKAELENCQADLGLLATDNCDTVETCIADLPVAIKLAVCVDNSGSDSNSGFDAACLEKEGLTAAQVGNDNCGQMFQETMQMSNGNERYQLQIKTDLFRCAASPRKCIRTKTETGYVTRKNGCCAVENTAWDETFTRVTKCCLRGADPSTPDGCAPKLPCVPAGIELPNGRECCSDANAINKMCVAKPRVCEPCDCQSWDGSNYSRCVAKPRSQCTRFCVQCKNDGVTPMRGDWTVHAARCDEYANGGAEAQLKDLLRELLF